jgi:hypothetical protein
MVNSKVDRLWRYLALIVVVGGLALFVADQLSPAAALAENPQLELPLRWEDDFEEYDVGVYPDTIFPDPPWKFSGLEGYTYNESLFPGGGPDNQFLQLVGLPGECAGSVAHRPIFGGGTIEIVARIRNGTGDRDLTGCHRKFGGIELSAGPHWIYPHRGLIAFSDERNPATGNRMIRGAAFEVDEGAGVFLQDFNVNQWYDVKIRYEHTGNNVQLSFWIDGAAKGSFTFPAHSYEPYLRYIGLWSGEDFAWHDDVTVWAADAPDPGDYTFELVYLPLVVR